MQYLFKAQALGDFVQQRVETCRAVCSNKAAAPWLASNVSKRLAHDQDMGKLEEPLCINSNTGAYDKPT